ncbi:multicomponent Na+:H+ antiporter subunit D [Natronorubrum sediminis]|uniref:Multicomponent Na+:H+ antiporter subunit D n=1 Tax=Natronorubrum sediminis TaxID=640943 RepID=A0A1H6FLQ2_9EURY|nr:proton-conducting transporter membrane subunit [Natronorubrum sediminis]SEH11801.1 multicomponent Na+:H+ antiporter subunit D [Natronorubrum sediminis]
MTLAGLLMLSSIAVPAAGALGVRLVSTDGDGDGDEFDRYWLLSAILISITGALTTALAVLLILEGASTYRLGFDGGFGFSVRSDALSATVGLLDVVLTLGILGYTRTAGPHGRRFHASYLLFTAAVFGVVFSDDLLGTAGFLLVLIVATGRLVECGDKDGTRDAATGYRRTTVFGTAVYLLGVLVAAQMAGSSDAQQLAGTFQTIGYTEPVVIASFVCMTVGLAMLVALVPLHGWLVETHARSPDPVSALISGVLPAAAVYALLRVLFDVFTVDFLAANPLVTNGIIYGAIVSLLVGNVLAYGQRNIKGMLAYSTVSQFGLVVAGLLVATETAVFGSVIQLFGHGLVKGAFCLIAGIIAIRFDARTIDEFDGIADRAPVVAAAFAGLGIAMIGLPPTVGFVGKWYIAVGALEEGLWIVATFVVISTILTLGYVIPFVDHIYFGEFDGTDNGRETITSAMVVVTVGAVVLALAIGLASVGFESLLSEAISDLVDSPA